MKNNHILYRILIIALIVLLSASGIINMILSENNKQLQYQVELRDSTLNKINIADSILCAQSIKNSEIIEQYINNCKFLLDGKEITSEELVLYINQINDSLKIYRSFYNLAKDNLSIDFSLAEIENGKVLTMEVPHDSLEKYKILYEMAEKKYGFKYITRQENEDLVILREFTKVDSAMMIYDYYKDKLIKDKDGKWMIIIEKTIKK